MGDEIYGWNHDGLYRCFVQAGSYAAAARAATEQGLPVKPGMIRKWGTVTRSADEVRLGSAAPGVVFIRPSSLIDSGRALSLADWQTAGRPRHRTDWPSCTR